MRDVEHAVRDLKAVLEPQAGGSAAGDATKSAPPEGLVAELRASLDALPTRLRELRETDEWRRWANAGIQEELVTQVEALKASKDLPKSRVSCAICAGSGRPSASRRDEADTLWQRFKSAADEVQARFDEQARLVAAEQAVHLATSSRCARRPRRWPSRPTGSPRPRR